MRKIDRKFVRGIYRYLFNCAKQIFNENPYLAQKYCELIFLYRKKTKVPIPIEIKRFICRKCFNLLIPGKTLKVTIDTKDKSVVYECLNCGWVRRYRYK